MSRVNAILPDRLARLDSISLSEGAHKPDGQMCVMEAVAFVAGEPWSDHPACACPVISTFLRTWNDDLPDDATRDRLLKPLIPLLVGTRSTPAVEVTRGYLALDWFVCVQTPAWLDLSDSLRENAAELRALSEIRDYDSLGAAIEPCKRAEKRAAAAWAAMRTAAWEAARAAAWAAMRTAAWEAAWAAAWEAAREATRTAAREATRTAAWEATRAAAWEAARTAAWAEIQSTVAMLQISAVDLVERMISAGSTR